jgi:hypothetical protein
LLNLTDKFPTDLDVWAGMISLCSLDNKKLSYKLLYVLGAAFSVLWKYHWRCVIDGEMWNGHAVFNMFQQDHQRLVLDILNSSNDTPTFRLVRPVHSLD